MERDDDILLCTGSSPPGGRPNSQAARLSQAANRIAAALAKTFAKLPADGEGDAEAVALWRQAAERGGDVEAILHRVECGVMTPEEAEAEAARCGLGPFETRPDSSHWDPMREPMWTVLLGLAWIIWRSPDMVRPHWDSYRRRCRRWRFQSWLPPEGPSCDGYILITGDPPVLSDIALDIVHLPPTAAEIECCADAVRLLRLEAQGGAFIARGVPTEGGRPRDIPPVEWSHLDVTGRGELRFPSRRFSDDDGYSDVRIPREALMRLFTSDVGDVGRSDAKPESDCQRWLEKFMRKSPHHRPKPRSDFEAEALRTFNGLSGRAFGRAWDGAIAAVGATGWKLPGRPKKSAQ